jgi:hypothetical protein
MVEKEIGDLIKHEEAEETKAEAKLLAARQQGAPLATTQPVVNPAF